MSNYKFRPSMALVACVAFLSACASQPAVKDAPGATAPAATAAKPEPAAQPEGASEAALEKKFQDAARGYKLVERDGKTLYCKREKVIGSTIPTMQCLTESQLRNQVETMDDMRERMRSGSKCTLSRGCSGS
jgi:hypothetical protein